MTKPKLTPESLRSIFLDLQAANLDAVVVGGQAVNLWATQYCDRSPQLSEFLPFASEDLDFYGGRIEVLNCRDALQGEARLNRDFDPSPNSGLVLVKSDDMDLRIDFLASVYGLNDAEIDNTAISFSGQNELAGINIKVLHPILCLEGKLRSLRGLPQEGRQDLKHVKMSILCVKEFSKDLCEVAEARSGLKLMERVLGNALREDGLSAWYRYGIEVESAIPIDTLTTQADTKWQRFSERRLPQILQQIHDKRNQYMEVMNRIATFNQNKNQDKKLDALNQSSQQVEQVNQNQLAQEEALATAQAVRKMLEHIGTAQPDGSVTFDSNSWLFSQQQNVITITTKQEKREILSVEGNNVLTFNPTPDERNRLINFREQVKLNFQQQQQDTQQNQGKGYSQ